jgi:hypothetical protein
MYWTSLWHVPSYRRIAEVKIYWMPWICLESRTINKLVVICFRYDCSICFKAVTKFVKEVRAVHLGPEIQTKPIVNTNRIWWPLHSVLCLVFSLKSDSNSVCDNKGRYTENDKYCYLILLEYFLISVSGTPTLLFQWYLNNGKLLFRVLKFRALILFKVYLC